MCLCIHTHAHMYICITHTHSHTQTFSLSLSLSLSLYLSLSLARSLYIYHRTFCQVPTLACTGEKVCGNHAGEGGGGGGGGGMQTRRHTKFPSHLLMHVCTLILLSLSLSLFLSFSFSLSLFLSPSLSLSCRRACPLILTLYATQVYNHSTYSDSMPCANVSKNVLTYVSTCVRTTTLVECINLLNYTS